METNDLFTVLFWLRKHSMQCPRCGGANNGHSTWIALGQQPACDNCFWPHDESRQAELAAQMQNEEFDRLNQEWMDWEGAHYRADMENKIIHP